MVRKESNSMKKTVRILVLFIFLKVSYKSYADAGFAYRFFIEITDKAGEKNKGYFYFVSWEEYQKEKRLIDFVKENSNLKELEIYSNILTLYIQESDLDFTDKTSGLKIMMSAIENIHIIEVLSYPPGERLILLNKEELNIVYKEGINYSSVYFKDYETIVAENCTDILLSAKTKKELDAEAKLFSERLRKKVEELNNSLEMGNGDEYFKFFQLEKKKLLKKGIVVFTIWQVL